MYIMKHLKSYFFFASTGLATCINLYGQERPNIIFILTDDQPYDMLGCTGNPVIETPNIDKLASEGVLFTNAHVSSAISTPSRTCLLTGRYERNHGVNFNSGTSLSAEAWAECYPVLLREAGYYTGYIGKNHTPIGENGYETGLMEESYDYWYGAHGHLSFYPKKRHEIFNGAQANTQTEILQEGMLDFLDPNGHNLEMAVSFLKKRPTNQPFFLNICFNLPHGAGTSTMEMKESDPEIYRTLYRDKEIPLPEYYISKDELRRHKLPLSVHHVSDRQEGYNYCDTPENLQEIMIREMQTVTGIDHLIGRLRDELKKQNLEKNTILIFTSDHGIFKGEFGLGGKSLCYEICTHVPLIIHIPGITDKKHSKEPGTNNELILNIDLPATMLNIAGVNIPDTYQGYSILPLLKGRTQKVRNYLFTENLWSTHFGNPRCESVQDKKWKYIRYYKNENLSAREKLKYYKEMGIPENTLYKVDMTDVVRYRIFTDAGLNGEEAVHEELFNLENDPKESTNLINNNLYTPVVERLREAWYKQLKSARGTDDPRVNIVISDIYSIPK